jgi:hypothetical protein
MPSGHEQIIIPVAAVSVQKRAQLAVLPYEAPYTVHDGATGKTDVRNPTTAFQKI